MQPSLLTRARWRLEDLRHLDDGKVIGVLILALALTAGGFLAARIATRAAASSGPAARTITLRQNVRVPEHGHSTTRWRVRHLYAQPRTVMRTQTISTPSGTRLVTRPVTRYRMVYRNRPVPAKTVTVTRQVTASRVVTATQRQTVVETTTAISTVTDTLPITVTVTVP